MTGRPIRVAFILPNLDAGGAQRVMITLMRHLDPAAIKPVLIALSTDGVLANRIPPTVERIDLGRPRLARAAPAVLRSLRRSGCDAVVSSIWHVNALTAAHRAVAGRPFTVLREANMPDRVSDAVPWWMFPRAVYRWLYPRADALIASSALMARALGRVAPAARNRITVLPNPVDVSALRDRAMPPRREPGSGRRFVAVGRLHRQKGFDRLLPLMDDLDPEDRLTVIGDGRQRADLEALRDSRGLGDRVRLHPRTDRPEPWIAGADALILPSRWEGLPNVALEALALGTPVIASRESGAIGEIADAAATGAVTIVSCGPEMIAAMRRVLPGDPGTPRACLLPDAFEARAVAAAFEALIRRGLDCRARHGERTVGGASADRSGGDT
ncbi:MAG: glycosyltransferase [Azospirillaceae bacterium]